MAKIIVRLLFMSFTIASLVNCVHDACDKNCLSDILALTKNNFTAVKNADSTLSSVFDEVNELKHVEGDDNDTIKLKSKKSNGNASWSTSHHSHNDNDLLDYMDFNEQLLKKPKVSANFAPKINANEKEFISTLSNRFLNIEPPFDLSRISGISERCRKHSKMFIQSLRNFELWALKMHDATAKMNSGLLSGNVNHFGDFDECMSVMETNKAFQGQYCLAHLQPTVASNANFLEMIRMLLQSHDAFKSKFEDSGHRLPRFSTINWALCVPSTCSREDVEIGLKEYVGNFTQGTGLKFRMQVSKEMCQTKDHNWIYNLDDNTKMAIVFFLSIFFISMFSSLYDYKKGESEKNPWFTAFSLVKNSKSLFSLDRDQNDIRSVHGIRFFNAVMLIISHKTMAMFYNPYMNRTSMSEKLGQPWTVIGRAASLYTDPFIMLSGLLTAYSLIGRLQKGQTIKVTQEYITRLFRIIPPLAALIFFCTFILPLMGSGPQWNLVVTNNADLCKQYWWRNLMFIHNYFGFEKMCLTHTHHVGIDTQLFLLAPILVSILWKWPRKGGIFLVALAVFSTIARFYVTMTKSLSNYVFFGTSVSQLFDTADFMYTLPAHRITVYIMGILLGYALRMCKDLKLTKKQLKAGWWLNTALIFSSFFGPAPMGSINYIYKPSHAAHYAAFAPIAWCSFFAWIIFSSHLGYNNSLTRVLQWKGFLISTRISYAIYLTQFPIFFFNVGKVRTPIHFGFIKQVVNTNEYVFVVLISIALTLFFEYPFTNIKKILFNSKPASEKPTLNPISSNNKISFQLNNKSIRYDATGIRSLLD